MNFDYLHCQGSVPSDRGETDECHQPILVRANLCARCLAVRIPWAQEAVRIAAADLAKKQAWLDSLLGTNS